MGRIIADYPPIASNRGPFFWAKPWNWLAARQSFLRSDFSNNWRDALHKAYPVDPWHSRLVEDLLDDPNKDEYKFIVLADTGEGDKSQYGLLPLIRALRPDFMIINGDVAYPAGNTDDFVAGFFEPYRNLNVPIWATPGNHEYYSEQHGTEFYQTFCTLTWAARWSEHGLKLVPQPGMFWEIQDQKARQVILGIDSGMSGNLDGIGRLRLRSPGDIEQHTWLTARLAMADARGQTAIAMFHIPGLVNGRHKRGTHLDRLHQTLLKFGCVRLVLTGHEHSFQQYHPDVFRQYVARDRSALAQAQFPYYMVAGGGGAYLTSTAWYGPPDNRKDLEFECKPVCVDDWGAFRITHRPTKLPRGHSVWGPLINSIDESFLDDVDAPDMLSFVLVEVHRPTRRTKVTPIFQLDFENLFASQPSGTHVNVQAGVPEPDPKQVAACRQSSISW